MSRGSIAAVIPIGIIGIGAAAGCSGGIPIDPPQSIDKVESTCEELSEALPDTLAGELARETKPESALTAAWGTPAIVFRCGVSPPTSATPTADLVSINGVEWFAEQVPEGYIFTSWGRVANVEVTVPDDYAPEADPLVELGPAIKHVDPKS